MEIYFSYKANMADQKKWLIEIEEDTKERELQIVASFA